jgi:hypothetical protein
MLLTGKERSSFEGMGDLGCCGDLQIKLAALSLFSRSESLIPHLREILGV